jgi:hypothetical protein
MKMFRKTDDGAIDNLLRAHLGRAGGPPPLCREFDPDLANAYVEHSLPVKESARYERHLSLCASCRKSVVALARMAEANTVFTTSDAKSRGGGQESEPRWKALLGAMSRPQWAMAAAAVIILAVSVPVFLSQKSAGVNSQARQSELNQPSPGGDAQAAGKTELENPANAVIAGESAETTLAQQTANDQQGRTASRPARSGEESGASVKETAENALGVASGAVAKSEPPRTEPVEAKTVDQTADQIASKDISPGTVPAPADTPAPQQTPPENQLAKIDPDKAKSVPEQSNEKAEVSVLQPGRPDGEQRGRRDAVVRSDEIAPPPAPSSGSGSHNAMAAPPGRLNSRLADPSRHRGSAGERKVGGKKFWLKDGTWIDKDYNPDKDMPVVTFIRDSDVYKELFMKRQGMKSYLTGFYENERVIFIYKGTVYMMVPQEGTK